MASVLVVEDSPTQAQEIQLLLQEEGYQVETAGDGQEALDRLGRRRYDLVLSDIHMPGMSGYDLCRRIKEDERRKDTPVVLLTVKNDPQSIMAGLECGADSFMSKPYQGSSLGQLVQSTLATYSTRHQRPIPVGDGCQVVFRGRTYTVTSDRERAVDYLASTVEDLLQQKDREIDTRIREERVWLERRTELLLEEFQRGMDVLAGKLDHKREVESRLHAVTDAVTDALCALDDDGCILWVNASWRRQTNSNPLLGPGGRVSASYLDCCSRVHGDCEGAARRLLEDLRELLNGRREESCLEYQVGTESPRWFEVRCSRVDGPSDVRAVVRHREISRLKLVQAVARDLADGLTGGGLLEPMQVLAGRAGRHLSGLVSEVLGHANLLALELESDDRMHEDLDTLRAAAKKVARVVDKLRVFGDEPLARPSRLDLNQILIDDEDLIRAEAGEGVKLFLVTGDELRPVRAERGELRRMLLELVRNVRDAARDDGTELVIETANVDLRVGDRSEFPNAQPGAYVGLAVLDNAEGMSPDLLERAFEPFFGSRAFDRHDGLGLAAVYGSVRRLGGHITVRSDVGEGTAVEIILPAYTDGNGQGRPV